MKRPLPIHTCKSVHCKHLRATRVGDSWDRGDEFSCLLTGAIVDGYCDHGELTKKIPDSCPIYEV